MCKFTIDDLEEPAKASLRSPTLNRLADLFGIDVSVFNEGPLPSDEHTTHALTAQSSDVEAALLRISDDEARVTITRLITTLQKLRNRT